MHAADPGFFGQANQRAFSGIADHAIIVVNLFDLGVIANKRAVEQTPKRAPLGNRIQRKCLAILGKFALRPITDAGDLNCLAIDGDLGRHHQILRQCAGLVAADHRRTSQSFHRRQAFD